jgi:hypothetical protein
LFIEVNNVVFWLILLYNISMASALRPCSVVQVFLTLAGIVLLACFATAQDRARCWASGDTTLCKIGETVSTVACGINGCTSSSYEITPLPSVEEIREKHKFWRSNCLRYLAEKNSADNGMFSCEMVFLNAEEDRLGQQCFSLSNHGGGKVALIYRCDDLVPDYIANVRLGRKYSLIMCDQGRRSSVITDEVCKELERQITSAERNGKNLRREIGSYSEPKNQTTQRHRTVRPSDSIPTPLSSSQE